MDSTKSLLLHPLPRLLRLLMALLTALAGINYSKIIVIETYDSFSGASSPTFNRSYSPTPAAPLSPTISKYSPSTTTTAYEPPNFPSPHPFLPPDFISSYVC